MSFLSLFHFVGCRLTRFESDTAKENRKDGENSPRQRSNITLHMPGHQSENIEKTACN